MLSGLLVLVTLGGCEPNDSPSEPVLDSHIADLRYVGSDACGSCHQKQFDDWQASHHAQAMQVASPATVLAQPTNVGAMAFDPSKLTLASQTADDPFPALSITHTFGVEPLQQYLVETQGGRKQALRWSWDSRPEDQGGERWFQLYPEEHIEPTDVLHWSGLAQNWNSMCADCHSTAVRKGYDPDTQSFDTRFEEISVGCEACHGPGSEHTQDPVKPLLDAPLQHATQPEVCAPCHARRSQLAEGFAPHKALMDFYLPELLNPPLYFADGQILDEVYVYGSFVSSKMHQAGVVCSDCHNPHSAELKFPGDDTCTQCHSRAGNPRFEELPKRDYAASTHHFHPPDDEAARCVSCHMPTRTYMEVDERHDHSFRRPMPGLSAQIDSPDPCTSCHTDQSPKWAESVLAQRPTSQRTPPHFAHALAQSTTTMSGERALAELASDTRQPDIARASALAKLANGTRTVSSQAILRATRDPSALVRHAALDAAHRLPAQSIKNALTDPSRAVRSRAAWMAATLNTSLNIDLAHDAQALKEFYATQRLNADRPEAQLNLAQMARLTNNPTRAEHHFKTTLELNNSFVPALINYADFMRESGRDEEGGALLRQATRLSPSIPDATHALALWHVRQGNTQAALETLADGHNEHPLNEEIAYTYAVALNSYAQPDTALSMLKAANAQQVSERLLLLQATIARDSRDFELARKSAQALLNLNPTHPTYVNLIRSLPGGELNE